MICSYDEIRVIVMHFDNLGSKGIPCYIRISAIVMRVIVVFHCINLGGKQHKYFILLVKPGFYSKSILNLSYTIYI